MGARSNPSRRQFVQGVGAAVVGAAVARARGIEIVEDAKPQAGVRSGTDPVLDVPRVEAMQVRGPLGERAEANVRQWLLIADTANPAMLQIFRDRDRKPPRDLVPWAGEFAGKYLISAVQAMRLDATDLSLRKHTNVFVTHLIATQAESGYLGPFPTAEGMMGKGRWDL